MIRWSTYASQICVAFVCAVVVRRWNLRTSRKHTGSCWRQRTHTSCISSRAMKVKTERLQSSMGRAWRSLLPQPEIAFLECGWHGTGRLRQDDGEGALSQTRRPLFIPSHLPFAMSMARTSTKSHIVCNLRLVQTKRGGIGTGDNRGIDVPSAPVAVGQ